MVKRLLFIVEIIHKVSGPGIQTRDHLIRQPAPESWNFWGCSLCIFHHLWSPPIKNKNRLSSFTIRSLKIYSLHRLTNHDGRASAFLTWEQGPMLWNTFCLNSFWQCSTFSWPIKIDSSPSRSFNFPKHIFNYFEANILKNETPRFLHFSSLACLRRRHLINACKGRLLADRCWITKTPTEKLFQIA